MRFQPSRLALMAAAVLTLSTAAVAVAQDGPPPPGMAPPMDDHGPGGHRMGRRFDPEAHAQHLRDVLQLRADQDGALKAYLAATGPRDWKKDGPKREVADAAPKPLTTPERLDRETERLTRAKARIDATRAFYAALSPSQKKAFDALGPMAGPMGGHGGPGMRQVEFRHFKGGHGKGPGAMPGNAPERPKAD
jgi:protein CpxP